MHLIFGGAYQGKLEYVKSKYGFADHDIFICTFNSGIEEKIDFSKKVIYHLEEFVRTCLFNKIEAKEYLEDHHEQWKDKVIICTDISSGIVPLEEELRAWREMVGRTMVYLGKEAEEITRLFCGIPQKLK